MKKNAMLKIAAILMVAVLLTTCAISSTFAKYVTSNDTTSAARVAKWGIELEMSGDDTAFAKEYTNGNKTVISLNDDEVVAPGTSKAEAVKITIKGTPEVSCAISAHDGKAADDQPLTYNYITLSNTEWSYVVKDAEGNESTVYYCPLVITVNDTPYSAATAEQLMANVNEAIEAIINVGDVAVATPDEGEENIDTELVIGWSWAFESGNDAADTALGNKAEESDINITFNFDVSVEQTGPAVAGN